MGGLAKKGVIVKGGVYIQEMSKIDTVVIDKTGTLTLGDPEVTDIVGLDGCSQKQILTYAAAAEKLSSHPLARAITAKAQELGANPAGSLSSDYLAGKGIISQYQGERVLVGNSVLMTEQNIPISEDAQATITNKTSEGKTTVIVAHGGHSCGVIGISDKIRNESRTAVQELGKMGISTIMLTGDNKVSANRVGELRATSTLRQGCHHRESIRKGSEDCNGGRRHKRRTRFSKGECWHRYGRGH
jgi:P-type E1-E2 ATPase